MLVLPFKNGGRVHPMINSHDSTSRTKVASHLSCTRVHGFWNSYYCAELFHG